MVPAAIAWDSIAQVVNLILLVFVVYKLLRKPAGDLVSKRQEDVASSLEAAEARLQEAEKKLAEYQARMNSAEEEAKAILERAEQAGKDASQRILEEAAQEAERLLQRAKVDAEMEREKALAAVRAQILQTAAQTAHQLVRDNLTREDQERLNRKFISEVGNQV
ncbi:MAG: F0F1 ATP synthase subunit B [Firmicutes bacterium]|nr:F0F1 ATP synthase subunit B [Bacillota bacterium]